MKNMFEETLKNFWEELLKAAPAFFWAGLILLLGIFIANIFCRSAKKFLAKLRLNSILKRIGLEESFLKFGFKVDIEDIISQIVKWFFVIVFLIVVSDILGLRQFSQFLMKVVDYSPNVFIATLFFIITVFLIDFSQKVFIGSLEKERITYSKFFGKWTNLSLWILLILAILYQLKIVPELILILFIGVIATLVLVLGISFGLAGKEIAQKFLEELKEKLK